MLLSYLVFSAAAAAEPSAFRLDVGPCALRAVLGHKQPNGLLQRLQLGLQIAFILEHGVVDAGLDQDEDQRGDGGIGDAQLGLQRIRCSGG